MGLGQFAFAFPGIMAVTGDYNEGFLESAPTAVPGMTHLHCQWHAEENIKTRIIEGGYPERRWKEFMDHVWRWLKNTVKEVVPENRAELLIRLDEPEQIYFSSHWLTKEARMVAAFTAEFPNLGCSGTSRNESFHRVLKEWLDPKYRLDRATEFLMDQINQIIRRIVEPRKRMD
ncbi:hypothetical protein BDD12DRAFT_885502 [Trichophaea hybrida]|nr:hypothetical protein BDD12DRAFT_885502 [Trichophaea hybrida]